MNLLDVAGVLVTLALVEYIHAPIAPSIVKFFSRETPSEVGTLHSRRPASDWVVPVRSIVVTSVASTSPPAAFFSTTATSSLEVEFGDPAITLYLNPSSRP